jgi:hypothetical protein
MLSIFKSNRCEICYTERIVRECPRKKKKICWHCCNELRCDTKCPEACSYSGKENEQGIFPTFKADSLTESTDVLKRYIDLWVGRENPHLSAKSPISVAEANQADIVSWLTGFQYPSHFPLGYLMQKLGIETSDNNEEQVSHHETCIHAFMQAVVRLAWDELRSFSVNQLPKDDLAVRYKEIMQSIPLLKKVSTYSIIHSGIGEDGVSALVYLELNHKQDWTILLSNAGGKWKIRQNILGSPKEYFAQNQIYSNIAEALGKADDAKVWELIQSNLKNYPDSPDLYYYRALYWQLSKDNDKAAVDFFNAISLDNTWIEPYFHLGALYLGKSDYQNAAYWFGELNSLHPDDPNAMNNLAACYAGDGRISEAKALWEKLLALYPTFDVAKKNLDKLNNG